MPPISIAWVIHRPQFSIDHQETNLQDLHVGRPSELASDENARRVGNSVGDHDLLDLVTEVLLDDGAKVLEVLDLGLSGRLLLLSLLELETLLGDTDELEALELLELGNGVLIDGVDEEKDLEALLLEDLKEGRVSDGSERLAGEVVDGLLDLGLSGNVVCARKRREAREMVERIVNQKQLDANVVWHKKRNQPRREELTLERDHLLSTLGRVESEELGELGSVLSILVDTQLDVLAKGLVELGKVVLVLGNLRDHVHRLLDNVLSDDLEDLVLLEGLSRDVEGKVLRVDDTSDEVEVLGDEVLAVVHDKDSSNVELDVVPLLLGLEEVERSPKKGSVRKEEKDE